MAPQGMTLKGLRQWMTLMEDAQGMTPMAITRWPARGGFSDNLVHNL